MNTPILFLIFNREDTTQRVFEAIRRQKPKYLFVAADGPRADKAGEAERCQRVRDIIQVDWDCELKTLYRKENLGCKTAVSEAITWFFDQVEQGVILEDDCLPDPSFFPYCEELLERYKDDDRVGCINGNCFLPGVIHEDLSYDFCSVAHIWGWASWRRVWKNYDVKLPFWEVVRQDKNLRKSFFKYKQEEIYFSSFISDTLKEGKGINTWDVQYLYTLRIQNQLSVYPAVNLVTNIGVSAVDATHTVSKKAAKSCIASQPIAFPLKHPQSFFPNRTIDDITFKKRFFSYKRIVRYFLKLY
ncbi:hemolytic protein HlpA [Bacteroidia bacterium]|nr:hemolytic protein HlpA [Bacteroidia bacterium]